MQYLESNATLTFMKKGASKRLTREQLAELKSLAALPDSAIDTSDAPEPLDWSGAKRGLFYRPVKQQLTLRLDADVVAWFKRHTTSNDGLSNTYQSSIARVRAGAGKQKSPISGLRSGGSRRLRFRNAARIRRCSRGRGTDVAAKSRGIAPYRTVARHGR